MHDNFERCLRLILDAEGGFSDDAHDSGGRTMWGITEKEYRRWKNDDKANVRNLTVEEMRTIYRTQYWNKVGADDLRYGLDLVAFDTIVNGGHPKEWLTRSGGDIAKFHALHLAYLRSLSGYRYFGKGWEKRQSKMLANALQMEREAVHAVDPAISASSVVYRVGSPVSEAVRGAQRRLNALGYAEKGLGEDGAYGVRTKSAVVDFESTNGLPMTGELSAETLALLMSANARPWPLPIEAAGGISGLRAAGDPAVKAADTDRATAVVLGAGAAASAANQSGLLDAMTAAGQTAGDTQGALQSLVSILKFGTTNVLPICCAIAAWLLYRKYGAAIVARVDKWTRPSGTI
jgi:peptidoglycan hydrolase-like protein with peptidoglycan-binding domain